MSNIFKSFDEDKLMDLVNDENVKKMVNENESVKSFVNNGQFNQFKEKYKDKSDDEILNDAKEYGQKLKNQYGEKEYNKKLEELKKFEMFLSQDQKSKLRKFLDNLK